MSETAYWSVLLIGAFLLGVLTSYLGGGPIEGAAAGTVWFVIVTVALSDLRR